MNVARSHRSAGFTLLEVMIATAIMSLCLATVFGSTTIAARSSSHARFVTQGALLARCRMTEVESYLRVNQLPEVDRDLDDPPETGGERCCESPFTCTARVERIELPAPADVSTRAGDQILNSGANALRDGGMPLGRGDGGTGAFGQLAGALSSLGSGTGQTGSLSGNGAPDIGGMASQLLAGIYPTLKPLLEGAIRRVTVNVAWNEGSRRFSFNVVQYYTNPGQTLASGDVLESRERQTNPTGQPPGNGPPGSPPPPQNNLPPPSFPIPPLH